jgi:GPN-loop GTPase
MYYGQIVTGNAASGKTTYAKGLKELLVTLQRDVILVNLDPGNSGTSNIFDIDICEIVTVSELMSASKLGPNGAMLLAMEQILVDFEWLREEIVKKGKSVSNPYFIFDFPGQPELYVQETSVSGLIFKLHKSLRFQLVCFNLVDSLVTITPRNFLSSMLSSLSCSFRLALPHINTLSKIDQQGLRDSSDLNPKWWNFRSFLGSEGSDTSLKNLFFPNHGSPSNPQPPQDDSAIMAVADLVEEYGYLGFEPLCVEDKRLMLRLVAIADKCNGYSGAKPDALTLSRKDEGEEFLTWLGETYFNEKTDKSDLPNEEKCSYCKLPSSQLTSPLLRCSRCKAAFYCSQECQLSDWQDSHKKTCKLSKP